MSIILTAELFAKLFPNAPKVLTGSFVAKQSLIVEILETPERLALACANLYAETSGYALAGLLENIHYTAPQMAHEWPNRFKSAADVESKYGTAPGWQNKAFDDIYGNRMGNRMGTNDGSTYIGRGGPQLTGRDEYGVIGHMIAVDLLDDPDKASSLDLQPDILGAYWKAKNFSKYADAGNITRAREIWNGGHNGLDVVQAQYPRLLKIIKAYNPATAAAVVQVPIANVDEALRADQNDLIGFGYHEIGEADGLIGGKTKGAIVAFCNDRNVGPFIYPSLSLDAEIHQAKSENWHRPTAPSRAFATTAQLAPKIESIAPTKSAALFSKIGAWFSGVSATGTAAVQFMPTAHDTASPYIAMAHEYFDKVPGWLPFGIVAAFAVAAAVKSGHANSATTAAYQQGKIN